MQTTQRITFGQRLLAMLCAIALLFVLFPQAALPVYAAEAGHISVAVTDGTNPVKAATVILTEKDSDPAVELTATAGDDGVAIFATTTTDEADKAKIGATYSMVVSADGYADSEPLDIVINDGGDYDIELTAATPDTVLVKEIKLTLAADTVKVGSSVAVTVEFDPSEPDSKELEWSSSDDKIATITVAADGSTTVNGIDAGTATITAAAKDGSGVTGTAEIKVEHVAPTAITVEPQTLNLDVTTDPNGQLTASVDDAATDDTVVWSTSNDKVATVNSEGLVTAVGKGDVNITATAKGNEEVSATCAVHVTVSVASISVEPAEAELKLGTEKEEDKTTLTVNFSPEDSENTECTWESKDEKIATVDEKGVVTAQGVGETEITAISVGNREIKASCKITVKKQVKIESIEIATSETATPETSREYNGNNELDAKYFTVTLSDDTPKISGITFSTGTNQETGEKNTAASTTPYPVVADLTNAQLDNELYILDTDLTGVTMPEFSIAPAKVHLTGIGFKDKTYDATADVQEDSAVYVFSGVIGEDKLNFKKDSFTFAASDAHAGKDVTVIPTKKNPNLNNSNYVLEDLDTELAALAPKINVNPAALTISLKKQLNKASDGTVKMPDAASEVDCYTLTSAVTDETITITKVKTLDWRYESVFPNSGDATTWKINSMKAEDFELSSSIGNDKIMTDYTVSLNTDSFKGQIEANKPNVATLETAASADGIYKITSKTAPSISVKVLPGKPNGENLPVYWYGDTNNKLLPDNADYLFTNLDGTTVFPMVMVEGEQQLFDEVYITTKKTDTTKENVVYGPFKIRYNYDVTAPDIDTVKVKSATNAKGNVDFGDSVSYTMQVADKIPGSGVDPDAISYYVGKTSKEGLSGVTWVKANASKVGDSYEFTVTIPAKGYLYVKAGDYAGNTANKDAQRALVVEQDAPIIEAEIDNAANYTKEHLVRITATDKGNYVSGVQKISYTLYEGTVVTDGKVESEGFIENVTPEELSKIDESWEVFYTALKDKTGASITDQKTLDGEYTLVLKATDFCGNVSNEFSCVLLLDNKGPTIKAEMGGSPDKEDEKYYYRADNGNLVVTITDNHGLLGGQYQSTATLTSTNGTEANTSDPVTVTPVETGDTVTYTFTPADVAKLKDGTVTLEITARDNAGNDATSIDTVIGMNANEPANLQSSFVLDKTAPTVTISTEQEGKGLYDGTDYYYNDEKVITTFALEDVNLPASGSWEIACDNKSIGVSREKEKVEVSLTSEGRYANLSIKGEDKAGNKLVLAGTNDKLTSGIDDATDENGKVTMTYPKVVDRTPPVAVIAYTSAATPNLYKNDAADENNRTAAYYNKDIAVSITVTDQYGPAAQPAKNVALDDEKLFAAINGGAVAHTKDAEAGYKIGTDGRNFVTIYGTDRAGNPLTVKEQIPGQSGEESTLGCMKKYDAKYTLVRDTIAPELTNATSTVPQGDYAKDIKEIYYNDTYTTTFAVNELNYDGNRFDAGLDRTDSTELADVKKSTESANNISLTVTSAEKIHHEVGKPWLEGTDKAGNKLVLGNNFSKGSEENKNKDNDYDGFIVKDGKATTDVSRVMDTVAPTVDITYAFVDGMLLKNTHYYLQDLESKTVEGSYYNAPFRAIYSFADEYGTLDGGRLFTKWKTNQTEGVFESLPDVALRSPTASMTYMVDGADSDNYFSVDGVDMAGNALVVTEHQTWASDAALEAQGVPYNSIYKKTLDRTMPTATLDYTTLDKTHFYRDLDTTRAYYNTDLKVSYRIQDANGVDETKVGTTQNGADTTVGSGFTTVGALPSTAEYTIEKTREGEYIFGIFGEDKAGNPLTVTESQTTGPDGQVKDSIGHNMSAKYVSAYPKVIDITAPTVNINYTPINDKRYYSDDEGTAYYNTAFEASFGFNDFNGVDENKMFIGRTLDGAENEPSKKIGETYNQTAPEAKVHSVKASDTNGHYRYTVSGEDKAGNALTVIEHSTTSTAASDTVTGKNAAAPYTGHHKVLDTITPKLKLELATDAVNKALRRGDGNDRYYFNKDFTATFTVEELNFDASKMSALYGETHGQNYMTDSVNERSWSMASVSSSGTTHTYESKYGADGSYRFLLEGKDRAGNPLEVLNVDPNPVTVQNYKAENDGEYPGDKIGCATSYVVNIDKVAPQTVVKIDDFYEAILQTDSAYTVGLNQPYQKRSSATATFTSTDNSPVSMLYTLLSTVGGQTSQVDNGDAYTYMNQRTSSFNAEQILVLKELVVKDLAGNVSTMGKPSNKIYLDVTAPTEDELAPTISMTATAKGDGRGPNGNPLFKSDVTVHVNVTDPGEAIHSSGLYKVYYKVLVNDADQTSSVDVRTVGTASNGVITYGTSGYTYTSKEAKDEVITSKDAIDFTFNQNTFNYNDIKIYVWAEDNSGNKLEEGNAGHYFFGIDVTDPKIEVSYDNNDAQNEKYFKADRTATVVVTERNFDVNTTTITTESQASIGGWTYAAGGMPNGDADTWTCQVTYSVDGDYTFDVKTTDLLGHAAPDADYGASVAPKDFVLDKTNPVITISFDNDNVKNGKYYDAVRTATVHVDEHNFSTDGATVETTANIQEGNVAAPAAGSWGSAGDMNTANVPFTNDGNYTMHVEYTDLAGNIAEPMDVEEFVVDTTAPELEIGGVEDKVAYNGDVAPSIIYHDINYDNTSAGVSITGYKHTEGSNLNGVSTDDAFGGSFVCNNIEAVKENDDIYTATGSVSDLAGNTTEATIMFSVNRFGSTYMLDPASKSLVEDYYTNTAPVIKVTEINVSELSEQEITTSLNGNMTKLTNGTDYTVNASKPGWMQYDYTINAASFSKEGAYTVTLHSKDGAANANSNRAIKENDGVTNELPIAFLLDMTPPINIINGVENGEQYIEAERSITVNYDDNTALASLKLYLNDQLVKEYGPEQLTSASGSIQYTTTAANDWQEFRVVSVDVAGNVSSTESVRYLLTANLFIQYINNKPIFYGSLGGVGGIGALIWFLLARKRRRAEVA